MVLTVATVKIKTLMLIIMCGLLGDNVAPSQALCVMRQMAGALRIQCFPAENLWRGTTYAYISKINYRNRSILRTLSRTLQLCFDGTRKGDNDYLGMKPSPVDATSASGRWPVLMLCNELRKIKHLIPERRDDNVVQEESMDPYMPYEIAPNHLLVEYQSVWYKI